MYERKILISRSKFHFYVRDKYTSEISMFVAIYDLVPRIRKVLPALACIASGIHELKTRASKIQNTLNIERIDSQYSSSYSEGHNVLTCSEGIFDRWTIGTIRC